MEELWIPLCIYILSWGFAQSQTPHQNWERGFSDQYKSENTLGQYAFGYNEDHTSGGSFRRETGDQYGNKIGSYGLRIADGRIRIVNYVADHNGYRAEMVSNEPGISTQKSNGYLEVDKRSLLGLMIPGFMHSVEAPHVSFSQGDLGQATKNQGEVEGIWQESNQDYHPASADGEFYAEANTISNVGEAENISTESISAETEKALVDKGDDFKVEIGQSFKVDLQEQPTETLAFASTNE